MALVSFTDKPSDMSQVQVQLLKDVTEASVFSFSFSSRWHRSARKGPYALRPVSQQSSQGCPRNSANICLVEHRSFSTLEGGMSAASFLHSSLSSHRSGWTHSYIEIEVTSWPSTWLVVKSFFLIPDQATLKELPLLHLFVGWLLNVPATR